MDLSLYPGDNVLRAAKWKGQGIYNKEEREFTLAKGVGACTFLCKKLGCVDKTAEDFFYAYHKNGKEVEVSGLPYHEECGRSIDYMWEQAQILLKKITDKDGNINHLTVTDCFYILENHVILETWEGLQAEHQFTEWIKNNKAFTNQGWIFEEPDRIEDKNLNIDIKLYNPSQNRYLFLQVKPISFFIDSTKESKKDFMWRIKRDRVNMADKQRNGLRKFCAEGYDAAYRCVIFEKLKREGTDFMWLRQKGGTSFMWEMFKIIDERTGDAIQDIKSVSELVYLN